MGAGLAVTGIVAILSLHKYQAGVSIVRGGSLVSLRTPGVRGVLQ